MKLFKSFRFMLVLTASFLLLATSFIVLFFLFGQYRTSMTDMSKATALSAFSVAETNINLVLDGAFESALQAQKLSCVEDYLLEKHVGSVARIVARRDMLNAISKAVTTDRNLCALFFFTEPCDLIGASERSRTVLRTDGQHPFYVSYQLDELDTGLFVKWLGACRLKDITLSTGYLAQLEGDMPLLVGASKQRFNVSRLPGARVITLLTGVPESTLRECYAYLGDESSSIYLLDRHGAQISGPDDTLLGQRYAHFEAIDTSAAEGSTHAKRPSACQIIYRRLRGSGWLLVKEIPMSVYDAPIARLRGVSVLIGLVAALLMGILFAAWTSRFFRPLKEVLNTLGQVREGNLTVQMEKSFQIDEFETLRIETNRMIRSVNQLLERTRLIERDKIELKIQNLQMQINPHMIFNSITAIRWMAVFSGAEGVDNMLKELAELMRPIFSDRRLTWTIREELNYVSHYMRLIELRYGAIFHTEINVDERLLETLVPLFTLQPLMENCCEHGLKNQLPPNISIIGRVEGEFGVLRVRDDGCGIKPEALAMLRARLARDDVEPERTLGYTRLGLINVHRRVRALYGEDCGLSIESAPGEGTIVTVRARLLDKTMIC
ncbi:MAG: sensor histidine kinase [Christensenellales bacterium]